jgi:hypothetical protein
VKRFVVINFADKICHTVAVLSFSNICAGNVFESYKLHKGYNS